MSAPECGGMTLRVSLSARGCQFCSTEEQQDAGEPASKGEIEVPVLLRRLQPTLNNCHPASEILMLRGE